MGNCVSFQLSCDQALNQIFRCLCSEGYIRTIKKNLKVLEREMEDLKAIHLEVQNKVAREEAHHQQMLEAVKVWLNRVELIDARVKNVHSASSVQIRKLCLFGLCSKYVCSSYNYGKKVSLLLEEVKILKSEGNFEVVTKSAPRYEVEERPTGSTIGQEIMLDKAWNRLMENGVGIMGLHGMGGVGKTTLFKRIHNKYAQMSSRFGVVIWIVVSQGANISKIQDDIAEKLHLCNEVWKNKNESNKAAYINSFLQGKRFILMLDDIWEKVDLEAIGVPIPSIENKCKVTFTTRSQEVCGQMGDHEPMQVKCLEPEEAWELFKNKVGDYTLRRDPVIVELARKVAEECRGLPLALCVIGEAMTSKTMVQEWEHAIDVLTTYAAEFSDMENKILPILKYSYDSLVDEHIKSCFLYRVLFPEDFRINKKKLIDYWICEGFIGDYHVIRKARNKGYTILGTLIRANLLMEVDTNIVVMHDVVRDLALWIASDFGKKKETFIVRAGVGLHEMPELKDWGAVRRMSLMKNNIKEITWNSKCPELTTLFLQQNKKLKNLSGDFIRSMQKLVVLDLSQNQGGPPYSFNELPGQITELASLKFLDLTWTVIEQLPIGFQELKNLTHLDLSYTKRLCSVGGISKLLNLRILKLFKSKVHGDISLVKELQLLENLQILTITISTELSLELVSGHQRLASCITDLEIQQNSFNISLLTSMKNLRGLWVNYSQVSDIDTYMKYKESKGGDSSNLHSPTIPCFTNLSWVVLRNCHSMKDVTWLLFAPNLVSLHIIHSEEVEEIINKEKATNLRGIVSPFQKLETIYFAHLPKLKSIYWSPLPFPFLKKITSINCPNLRKLPLNATSVPRVEDFEIDMYIREEGKDIEWEDKDTKDRFLPLLHTYWQEADISDVYNWP